MEQSCPKSLKLFGQLCFFMEFLSLKMLSSATKAQLEFLCGECSSKMSDVQDYEARFVECSRLLFESSRIIDECSRLFAECSRMRGT